MKKEKNETYTVHSSIELTTAGLFLSLGLLLQAHATGSYFAGTGTASTNQLIPYRSTRSALPNPLPSRGPGTISVRSRAAVPAKRTLAEAGPHSRTWTITPEDTGPTNATAVSTARSQKKSSRLLVEIASGMNFWNGESWVPSNPTFDLTPQGDAFVAERVQHKVRLTSDINTIGAVTLAGPDGAVLRSTPVAIGLLDPVTGRFGVVGTVTNCTGILCGTNQVLYARPFVGVCASLLYSLDRGSFAQDVIFTGRFDPRDYGFPTNSRIQIISEFYSAPQPLRTRRPLYVEKNATLRQRMAIPDLIDETLGFGELVIGPGKAGPTAGTAGTTKSTAVAKEFKTINSADGARTFLIESVSYHRLQSSLLSLPECGPTPRSASVTPRSTDGYAMIPKPRANTQVSGSQNANVTTIAEVDLLRRPGVAVDYPVLIGPGHTTPAVFAGDTTYFVEGPTYCYSAKIEGGAIFKHPSGTYAPIMFAGNLTCTSSSFRPIIFTAADDESIGESVQGFWAGWSGTIPQDTYYANPAIIIDSAAPLEYLRFCYAQQAVEFGNGDANLRHSQFVNCIGGISLTTLGCGCNLGVNNCLFANVQYPLNVEYVSVGGAYQCTFDGEHGNTGTWTTSQVATFGEYGSGLEFKNCIFANFTSLFPSWSYCTGDHNAFYNCNSLTFGDNIVPVTCSGSPFQAADYGRHYLKSDSGLQGHGIELAEWWPAIATSKLKGKTTSPPVSLPPGLEVTGQLVLSPDLSQVPRYISGSPDLGYYYPVLDYTVANVYSEGGAIHVAPGTAIAVRNNTDDFVHYTWTGFILQENSTLVSHGTPEKPIVFTTAPLVQEGPFQFNGCGCILFAPDCEGDPYLDLPPALSLRFSDFSLNSMDLLIASGNYGPPLPMPTYDPIRGTLPLNSSMRWGLQDCELRGGQIFLGKPYHIGFCGFPAGAISWVNNLFDRVIIDLEPCYSDYSVVNIDLPFNAYNNLFRGGLLYGESNPTSAGNWIIRDNLFDGVAILQEPTLPLDHDDNAYWQTTRLIANNDDGGTDALHDQVLNAAPQYQIGPFGAYYLPTGSLNPDHSRTTVQAGLSKYTTRYDQVYDAANVTIGVHYVATSGGTIAVPKASGTDGVPDYVADADGNGVVDATDPSPRPTQANKDFLQVPQNTTDNQLPTLSNDTDSLCLPLSIFYPAATMNTTHGTVRGASDSLGVIYTPSAGFYGVDSFTYGIVNDFNHESSTIATVFVSKAANHPPVAGDDSATMSATATSVTINLLPNDSDPDTADILTIYSLGQPQLGTATLSGAILTYTRPASVYGLDVFTYALTDGNGGCAVGTIRIDRASNGTYPPAALSYNTSAIQGEALNVTLTGSDPDGQSIQAYTITSAPKHATSFTGSGPNWVYTADPFYYGPDFIQYTVSDASGVSPPATITIGVKYFNAAPIAEPISISTRPNTAAQVTLSARDLDGDRVYLVGATTPGHGTLSGVFPNFTYTPSAGYSGLDSFTFTVNDGKINSTPGVVSIAVDSGQYSYPLTPGTQLWTSATPTDRIASVLPSQSWRAGATGWQMFSAAMANPYLRTIWTPGNEITRSYNASRNSPTQPLLSTVDTGTDFGTNVLRYLSSLNMPLILGSTGDNGSPCLIDYIVCCHMASRVSTLQTLEQASLQRLFRIAAWDADLFGYTSVAASAPIRLMYGIYQLPESVRGSFPVGVGLPALSAEQSSQLDMGLVPPDLTPSIYSTRSFLDLISRP